MPQIEKTENRWPIEYDRFNLARAVGSYRDTADHHSMGNDWSRPWTKRYIQQSFERSDENVNQ